MKLFSNIHFLSILALNNIKEYFIEREASFNDILSYNSVYWYGHATTLINLSGTIILTDPVITNRLGFFKRVVNSPCDLTDKSIDYIILSHGHMDHMHFPSLKKLDKNATVIVPKGYKHILSFMGFNNVVLLKQGETYEDDNIKISAIKANHDGRRFYIGIDDESNSYIIEKNGSKIFFAGDTAYTEDFKGIECDVAIMPVGCYKPDRFSYMHCTPEESYKMFKTMNASAMIPIHYKTFKISLEKFEDTYNTLNKINDPDIKILNIGQSYKFKE